MAVFFGLPVSVWGQDPSAGALAAARRGHLDSAYVLIRRAAAAAPDSAPVQFWLGEIAAVKASSAGVSFAGFTAARRAKAGFARAVELEPDNPDYLQGLAEFLVQAPGIVGGDRDSGLALAEHLRRVDAVRGILVEADILQRAGRRGRAQADSLIEALTDAYPEDRAATGGAANYFGMTGRPERGVPLYDKLARRDSSDLAARYGVARLLVMEGREPSRAEAHLRFVLAHSAELVAEAGTPGAPGRRFWFSPASAWWNLGQTYRQLGLTDSARICYQRALALSPGMRQARLSLDSLR
jgi:tetratricopeptide (TPR) repeat protein